MRKEQLKQYLNDQLLMQAIFQKTQISDTRKKLYDALSIATETGLSEIVIGEIDTKINFFNKIRQGYSDMIEDVWGVNWQGEEIIKRYMDLTSDGIDELPDVLKN